MLTTSLEFHLYLNVMDENMCRFQYLWPRLCTKALVFDTIEYIPRPCHLSPHSHSVAYFVKREIEVEIELIE
jgi:hypothetical protein